MSPSGPGPNVSWVGVGVSQYSGGQCETLTYNQLLPPPELMSATYLSLQWPDKADKVDSTTTTISNVKLQKYFDQEKY